MWLAYLDETGNTGRRLDDPDQPLHVIGCLLLPEEQIQPVHTAMRELGRKWFAGSYRDPDFEFHGASIFGGSDHFASLSNEERVELYAEILAVVGGHDGRVIVRGVNKPRLAARYADPYHPHDISLMYTLEEIERFARKESRRTGHTCRVLVVADENQENEDAALRDLASYQELGTRWGWNPEMIDHVVDTIHFVDSKTNWAMQLADCLAFIAGRRLKIVRNIVAAGASSEAVSSMWKAHVSPALVEMKIWDP